MYDLQYADELIIMIHWRSRDVEAPDQEVSE